MTFDIRPAVESDKESILNIFYQVVATGETYTFTAETSREEALAYWYGSKIKCYVATENGVVIGMAKLISNHSGLGSHVANASFMVDPHSQSRGVGRRLGVYILNEAKQLGYLAMQFNLVISTNERAVKLWQDLGFKIVGTLPQVFQHKTKGLVDAFVMHRFL